MLLLENDEAAISPSSSRSHAKVQPLATQRLVFKALSICPTRKDQNRDNCNRLFVLF